MVPTGRNAWVAVLIASLTLVQGCRHLGTPEVAPGTAQYPEKNPGTIRQVLIRGTVASTLKITLSALYRGKVAADCYKTTVFSGEIFEGQTNPFQVTVPLSVSRDGNKFSATFEVDKFIPGKCGWHFSVVVVQVLNGKNSFGPAVIIQPPGYPSEEGESIHSSDGPVILRCRDLGKLLGYSCIPPGRIKSQQTLVDTTTVVNVEIYDDDPR